MTIEVTDEMVQAARAATCGAEDNECMRDALTAAFALVERDMGLAGPCSVGSPTIGDAPPTWCQLRHGHTGDHVSGVTRWRERTSA
jgi:hypothetical protein